MFRLMVRLGIGAINIALKQMIYNLIIYIYVLSAIWRYVPCDVYLIFQPVQFIRSHG